MPLGWYAVYTRHQHEKSATQILTGKGFQVFLPLYRSAHRWKDRTQIIFLPLFSSYLFIRADMERRIEVLRTPGVCWFVANAGVPCQIAQREIESLRVLTESPAAFQPHPFLDCGDRVRVISGPLAGLEGIVTRSKKHYRVVLSVGILQKSAAVEVDSAILERVLVARPSSVMKQLEAVS